MTRQSWTTNDQKEWLEPRKAAFIEAKQKGPAAMKDFCQGIYKEFREKWPVSPVTETEIAAASTAEQATKNKRDKYDKRVREWFHNNTRVLSANAGPRSGLLKITGKPKMLQDWQAYQALTYEQQWKPHVDEAWATYKTEWEAEHPNEKPPKKRIQIMVEFMKEKYKNETVEMKARCEEYRQARKDSPVPPSQSGAARNLEFQLAIDKLPRTLATFSDSIMKQTGWNVTIMAGGPYPENDGNITTFLSHAGKTKAGETFEKFLGPTEYDKNLLAFEQFLHASFSKEDRHSRRLIRGEVEDEVEEGELDDNVEEPLEGNKGEPEGDNGQESVDSDMETGEVASKPKPVVQSEYSQRKQQNIEALKKKLDEVKALYPIPKEQGQRQGSKKPVSKFKEGSDEPMESQRTEEDMSTAIPAAPVSTTAVSASTLPTPGGSDGIEQLPELAKDPSDTATSASPAPLVTSSVSPTLAIDTSERPLASSPFDAATSSSPKSVSVSGEDRVIESLQSENQDDVIMQDATSSTLPEPQNDDDLPTWLVPMIGFLRRASADAAWQDLVAGFVDFEKRGPPHGKLPTKFRPQEVSDWIRSKKKEVIPSLKLIPYGKALNEWWTMMQPSWRKGRASLIRVVPPGEDWRALRKGGTSGIYVVLVGLSWWIKTQQTRRDPGAWTLVDDLTWVIQQMKMGSGQPSTQKRARDGDAENDNEVEPRKLRRQSN